MDNIIKKPVKNVDLWKQYIQVAKIHIIEAVWTKGHAGHLENERCDLLAKEQAQLLKG